MPVGMPLWWQEIRELKFGLENWVETDKLRGQSNAAESSRCCFGFHFITVKHSCLICCCAASVSASCCLDIKLKHLKNFVWRVLYIGTCWVYMYRFGHPFELPLLIQSIVMNSAMFAMVHVCVSVQQPGSRRRSFAGLASIYHSSHNSELHFSVVCGRSKQYIADIILSLWHPDLRMIKIWFSNFYYGMTKISTT